MLAKNYVQNPGVEDIDLTGFRLKLAADLFLKSYSATAAEIVNDAGTLEDLRIAIGFFSTLRPSGNAGYIDAPLGNNKYTRLRAGLNGVATEVGRLKSHATTPILDILELACSTLPVVDPADGLSRIWSNGGVLTLGT